MKYIIFVIAFSSSFTTCFGQNFNLHLDHSTILVKNLEVSSDFYMNIIHLKELETPWGVNPSIRFFSIGENQQLHLAHVETDSIKLNKVVHMAFTVQNFDEYLLFLNNNGIDYKNFAGNSMEPQLRPDGVKQIYFQDPDGYWIEINNAKY